MYPPRFDYHRPTDVGEAIDLLAEGGRVLSGGQSLLTELKARQADPGRVIDVGRIPSMSGLDVGSEEVRIGAATTYADLVDSADARRAMGVPGFVAAATHVGDPQVRNRGTVGGNLAQADPEGDLPSAALAADASIRVEGPDGERTIPAAAFVEGPNRTTLEEDELVTEIRLSTHDAGGYARRTHPASGYAMISAAAVFDLDSERETPTIGDVRVAAGGAVERPVRLEAIENALEGTPIDDPVEGATIRETVIQAIEEVDDGLTYGDRHATESHRRELLPTYVERAIENALDASSADGAGGGSR